MKVYLSGIGGIGMSAYASHMRAAGHEVSGSDRAPSDITRSLGKNDIHVWHEQDGSHVPPDTDLFVYSEAIPKDAPERIAAHQAGAKCISYFQALGELTAGTQLVTVCGTHGKSSTTAMAGRVLIDTGHDPSIVVGTKMFELQNLNWRRGESGLWLVEACEYRLSFLHLSPQIILVTNVDWDHADAFPTQEAYIDAFSQFFKRLPQDGTIIFHGKDKRVRTLMEESKKNAIDVDGIANIDLSVPGTHMQENARLVMALAKFLGIDDGAARASLAGYQGSWRRFEKKGSTQEGAIVIDDYAHHPKEIRAALESAKIAYPGNRILCVFQPHTHDRTKQYWGDFATCFAGVDTVILSDVYDARSDIENGSVDMQMFADAIQKGSRAKTIYAGALAEVEKTLHTLLQKDDILLIMGAGDVTDLARRLAAVRAYA